MKSNVSPYNKPHRRLILNSGDIYLPREHKINPLRNHASIRSHPKKDKLYSFKEECTKSPDAD